MFKILPEILIFSLILNQFQIFGQSSENKRSDIEIGINVFSYLHNLIGSNTINTYKEKFVPRYFDGLSFKYLGNNFQYRFDFSSYKYHNQYKLSELIHVDDFDEELDGIFKRFNMISGIEKDFLEFRIRPQIFVGINFYYTEYTGDCIPYFSWEGGSNFNIKSLGIGLLISPGVRIKITDKIFLILESSLGINRNFILINNRNTVNLLEYEIKINPIETLGINYRFNLK
jgi:hypothetical protein